MTTVRIPLTNSQSASELWVLSSPSIMLSFDIALILGVCKKGEPKNKGFKDKANEPASFMQLCKMAKIPWQHFLHIIQTRVQHWYV